MEFLDKSKGVTNSYTKVGGCRRSFLSHPLITVVPPPYHTLLTPRPAFNKAISS